MTFEAGRGCRSRGPGRAGRWSRSERREWENWYERADTYYAEHPGEPRSPLLDPYAAHPLHQAAKHIYGHTTLTAETQAELDTRYSEPATDADVARLGLADTDQLRDAA